MFCTNCGNQVPDGAKFCTVCGAPIAQNAPAPQNEASPVRQAPPVRAQQPAYQAAPQAVPVYAVPAAKAGKLTKWPVSTGIMGILHFLLYLGAQIPIFIYFSRMGTPELIFNWSRIIYVICARAVPILFFVHTKKIAILTAIPMVVILVLEGISFFSSLRYLSSYDIVNNMLTFVPMFILTVLYVIQMAARPRSAALPVIYLIFAIIGIVLSFVASINLFRSSGIGTYTGYLAGSVFFIWVADIFAHVAYIIAMFSSRKK